MEQIESNVFLDGFCAIARNWTLLGKSSVVSLPKHLKIERWSRLDLKGVQQLKNLNITRISLGSFNGIGMSVLVTSQNQNERMNFSLIRSHFLNAVDFAITQMDCTMTKSNWMGRCCVEYEKWVNGRTCGSCKGSQLKIFPVDITYFGQIFHDRFNYLLNIMEYQSFLCLLELGQNVPILESFMMLRVLELQEADEVVLHLARDFKLEEKCLLWNRKKIIELFGKPTDEFYPGFTGGHGNFNFDFTTARRPPGDNIVTQTIKFYCDSFKEIHRGNPSPFKKPVVVAMLTGKDNTSFTPDNMLGWLAAVERSNTEILKRSNVVARMESIISMTDINEDFISEYYDFFHQHFGPDKYSMLSVFDFNLYSEQLSQTIIPAIRTLKEIIQNFKHDNALNDVSIPSVATLNLASVCEALISFAVYGKLNHWQGYGERFCSDMKNILGLKYVTFSTPPWIYTGLAFTKYIQVAHSKLIYVGPFLLTKGAYCGLSAEISEEMIEVLNLCLYNLRNTPSQGQILRIFEKISIIIWNSLVSYSISILFPNQNRAQIGLNNICNRIKDVPVDSVCVKKFSKYLLSNTSLGQQSVFRIISTVRQIITQDDFANFKDIFAKTVELELWKSNYAFLYPKSDGVYWLVLALYGNEQISFSSLSVEKRQKILGVYTLAYEKEWGKLGITPSPIRLLEDAEHLGWNSRISVHNVFHQMCMEWLAANI